MKVVINRINGVEKNSTIETIIKELKELEFVPQTNNSKFLKERLEYIFEQKGWIKKVKIDPRSNLTIQYLDSNTAIMYYFSNKARCFLDFIKIQHLFNSKKIHRAVYVVFRNVAAVKVASNLATYEKICNDLEIFNKIFTCPILLIGIS